MNPRNEASRSAYQHGTAQAINRNPRGLKSTATADSRRALPRRRGTFPTGDFRRLVATGTLGDWLVVATATRLSVTGTEARS